MYNRTKLLTGILALVSIVSFGQEEKKSPLTISGSVDAYYQTYLTTPDDIGANFGTAFAKKSGFAVGMGNVVLSYEGAKTGMVLDLVVGPKGEEATFNSDIVDGIVNQAYIYWNVSEKTTLTLGRFNTFLGYEVISPTGNFNYSTSHLFSNGPFSHVGLKADFALTDDFSLMLAVTNPWDTNDTSITGEYALGLQLGFKEQFLNFYYDSGDNGGLGFEVDYTGGFDLSEKFFLGINAAYQTSTVGVDIDGDDINGGFYGVALYPQAALSDAFSLGLRGEYFARHLDDVDSEFLQSTIGVTLTGSYSIENLTFKPEVRLDSWGNDFEPFVDSDGDASSSLAAFTLAAIYSF